MTVTVGIDLGTTNSSIAFFDGHNANIIETAEGARFMPSVVAWTDKGEMLVGRPALRQININPDHTIQRVKRLMGQDYNDLEAHEHYVGEGPNGTIVLKGRDRNRTPQEISAILISAMLDAAQSKLGIRPDGAVITVPAVFDTKQKAATMEAGWLAGLQHVELMPEPTAAALAYSIGKDKFEFQMLYGIRRDLQASLSAEGYGVRVYVPFGREWFPYFMRRLGERPANVKFVLGSVLSERRP